MFLVMELLAERGQEHERNKREGVVPDVKRAAETLRILTPQEVRTLRQTSNAVGSLPVGSAIQLRPPNHERNNRIAVLWSRWDFSVQPARCGFHYGTWYHFRPPPRSDGNANEMTPGFLGYRYETPEIGTNHRYYHCQPCMNLGDRNNPLAHAIDRSEFNPTWPLAADNSIALLLCLVLSLYGMDEFRDIEVQLLQSRAAQRNLALTMAIDALKRLPT